MNDLTPALITLLDPADELAATLAEIERLKARVEELRLGFITRAELPRVGRNHRVEVVEQKAQVFDATLLPPEVRNDPQFLRTRITRMVRTKPLDPVGDAMRAALARWEQAEDLALA